MSNSPEMTEAIKNVIEKIEKMSPEEFQKELDKHKDGDVAIFMKESGAIDIIMDRWKNKGA